MNFNLYKGYDPTKKNTYRFFGLNRNRFTDNGEFEDMTNMSSREYPCAAPRGHRKSYAEIPGIIQAVAAPDSSKSGSVIAGFTGIADGAFYYDGVKKSGKYVLRDTFTWSIVRKNMLYVISGYNSETNAHVMYFYNINTNKFDHGGAIMDNLIVTAGADENGSYLQTFRYRFSGVNSYSVTNADGDVINNRDFFNTYFGTAYSYAKSTNIFEEVFSVGDQVTISGFPTSADNRGEVWYYNSSSDDVVPQEKLDYSVNNTVDADMYASFDDVNRNDIITAYVKSFSSIEHHVNGVTTYSHLIYFNLYNKNDEAFSFDTMESTTHTHYCSGVTISKRMPKFDNICIFNHSLFGSLFNGNALYGSFVNELTDFQSTDENGIRLYSYLESDYPGKFTGLCVYNNELIAFKESSISIIYGSNYSSYSQYIISGIGCIDKESIAVTPRGIIFLSYNGFYMFTGSSTPMLISSCMKDTKFISAIGGYDEANRIYYACAVDSEGHRLLYTYSLDYSIWHIEDDINVSGMFMYRGGFYIADKEKVYLVNMFPAAASDKWSFTSVRTHNSTLDNKTINEIWIRADCDSGGRFTVEVSVDDGEWTNHGEYGFVGLYVYHVPVRIESGSTFRYRISGNGNIIIHEIELNMPTGGRSYKAYPKNPAAQLPGKSDINFKY